MGAELLGEGIAERFHRIAPLDHGAADPGRHFEFDRADLGAVLLALKPTLRLLESNAGLYEEYKVWAESRGDFNKRLKNHESEAVRERWQRHYMRGTNVATGDAAGEHVTKRKLKTPMPPLPGLGE